jgi:hypothetical protein
MPQFICDQGHKFHYPAKQIRTLRSGYAQDSSKEEMKESFFDRTIEKSVCPECNSIHFTEYVEPSNKVQNVYVYDLTSGPQTTLDALLAQDYDIVARYAKAYHLEKKKPAEKKVEQPDPDSKEAAEDNSPENTKEWKDRIDCTQAIANSTFDKEAQSAYKKLETKQP